MLQQKLTRHWKVADAQATANTNDTSESCRETGAALCMVVLPQETPAAGACVLGTSDLLDILSSTKY